MLILNTKYPGRVTAPTAAYPQGSTKNETTPGAGDGTPYELARGDDVFGLQQALVRSAGITPNGNSDTALLSEQMQSIIELASGRAFNYDDSGVADAYVLDVQTNQQAPSKLFDGLEMKFFPGNTNTGASTADPFGKGVTNIKLVGGVTDPAAGQITAGVETTVIYRSAPSAHLELQYEVGVVLQTQRTADGAFASGTTTSPGDDTIPQNTEGNQFMSVTLTPKAANSKLIIEVLAQAGLGAQQHVTCALFQDSISNALVADKLWTLAGVIEAHSLEHEMIAGTLSPITFKVRIGAVAGTTYFNGDNGGRKLGGVLNSFIKVTETSQ